jgi:DNA-binding NarL/FixJ family response regulator
MSKKTINIALVDDHAMFLDGLAAIFDNEDNINIVFKATSAQEILNCLKEYDIDIIVTDISMPEMDGIELNIQIKSQFPKVKTLVLSTHNDPDKIEKLIKKDVDGYLLKNAEKGELLEALESIQAGNKYFSRDVKEAYMNQVFHGEEKSGGQVKLSRREKEILKYLAEEYTAKEIADLLFISAHTVHTHKKNLISKLHVKNSAGLVKYAIQNGLAE